MTREQAVREEGRDASVPQGPSEAEIRELREELEAARGPAFWRRLEELSETSAFQAFVRRWFPSQPQARGEREARREFLRRMGASLAVAGLGACTRQPEERILPYAKSPEALIPGRPRYFASALPTGSDVIGVLVESHMNRPTKVEGNPDHPASLGATDGLAQAAVLGLYDPDRSHSIRRAGQISTWDELLAELGGEVEALEASAGEGLAVLVDDTPSPTRRAQLEGLRERFPRVRLHHWAPVNRDHARRAALEAFDADVRPLYAFDRARVVLALDAEFLASGAGGVRHARDFAAARRVRDGEARMNRLYAVESSVTISGAMADHRLAVRPSEVEPFARALAHELGVVAAAPAGVRDELRAFARTVAKDLVAQRGECLVVAGEWTDPSVQALAHRLNHALGNHGRTVEYTRAFTPFEDAGAAGESIAGLVDAMRGGRVTTLFVLGGNPVYDAPADLDFEAALRAVPFRLHLAERVDETSRLCQWHVPAAHALERWSDAVAWDGTVSIVQPLIAPLYGGRTSHALLAALVGRSGVGAHDLVREHWLARLQAERGVDEAAFDEVWQRALHDGAVAGARAEPVDVTPTSVPPASAAAPATAGDGLELSFRPDASVFDGRYANNGWLQETPRPLTRLTWDNAVLMSPATAERLGVATGDVVELTAGERSVEGPVWETPGHPDEALTVHLGYGRTSAGQLGDGVGFDAYRLRASDTPWHVASVAVRRTGARYELASVQDHARMEGRDLVKVADLARFQEDPAHAIHRGHDVSDLSMYPDHAYDGYAWGMVIDLNSCIGCNACMVACQSENNVPIVGKEEVQLGREMHWIRIDRYYEGDGPDPEVLHQPVPCMHCENAPCEVVCPVNATVHGPEGLNEMVYNRCVGTRYCANNCPYKVRRFNFYLYADFETESLKLGNNPDVTVRSRGVMEKCTYCVQRINHARIEAKKDEREIRDGEVVTACQQVCPAQAISFGDINDPQSRVSADRSQPHHYSLLEEVGTRPRTTYLAKLSNKTDGMERG